MLFPLPNGCSDNFVVILEFSSYRELFVYFEKKVAHKFVVW